MELTTEEFKDILHLTAGRTMEQNGRLWQANEEGLKSIRQYKARIAELEQELQTEAIRLPESYLAYRDKAIVTQQGAMSLPDWIDSIIAKNVELEASLGGYKLAYSSACKGDEQSQKEKAQRDRYIASLKETANSFRVKYEDARNELLVLNRDHKELQKDKEAVAKDAAEWRDKYKEAQDGQEASDWLLLETQKVIKERDAHIKSLQDSAYSWRTSYEEASKRCEELRKGLCLCVENYEKVTGDTIKHVFADLMEGKSDNV